MRPLYPQQQTSLGLVGHVRLVPIADIDTKLNR